jgi:hypothetical protein
MENILVTIAAITDDNEKLLEKKKEVSKAIRQKNCEIGELNRESNLYTALIRNNRQELRALNKPLEMALIGRQGALLPVENRLDDLPIDD